MASLEQLADEQQISPLSRRTSPLRDQDSRRGPFIYEFEIECAEFDLPEYKG